jgi:L-lactate dehydrogenase (cytochrome)
MGGGAMSISRYFTDMLDPAMTWDDVAAMVQEWGGQFCLKGVMSVEDARRAADIGCTGIVLSNHGGRQLDGSRSAFDQLAEIVDAVGDRIDVMMDGGVQRGTHVLKALALGARFVFVGRPFNYAAAVGGEAGVSHAIGLLRAEVDRNMAMLGINDLREMNADLLAREALPAD